MSHCVPSWDIDDTTTPPASKRSLSSHSNSTAPAVPMLDYEVAELTWENGQVAMHGLGPPRLPPVKPFSTTSPPPSKYTATTPTWVDKQLPNIPRACGTLESIVNQAAATKAVDHHELVTWFDNHRATTAAVSPSPAPSTTVTMDALVPCRSQNDDPSSTQVIDSLSVPVSGVFSTQVKQTTGVGSCSGAADTGTGVTAAATQKEDILFPKKQTRMTRVPATPEWTSSRSPSVSGSGTFGMDSHHVTLDTKASDHDSVCHSTPQRNGSDEEDRKKRSTGKSSVSTKRSRAAAVHNQSERKRRDKINQRMKTLQKLVPNSSKTDKASMLDEVIEYLKQLQAQVQMMSRMNMPAMMLPMALQQQLQMSMMAPRSMGLGIGMGMGMDMNTIGRPNITGIPPILHPSAFMPMASWDGAGTGDKLQAPSAAAMPDPLSAFLACQSQPMTMDSYSMMTAMYQQFQQPPASIVPRAN